MHVHAEHGMSRAFAAGITANALFVVVELVCGVVFGSVALVSDAVHNVADVLGLALAATAAMLARRSRTLRRTYGLRRATILAALANGALVLLGVSFVVVEAVQRLRGGGAPHGTVMIIVAATGVVVNAGCAVLFARDRHHDANVRGAFLHLVSDAGVSVAVVIGGALIALTGETWIDPVLGLVVSAVVVATVWPFLREAIDLAVDAVPKRVDPKAIRTFLERLPGTRSVHDLHIWPLSTTETALTVHLVSDRELSVAELERIAEALRRDHRIDHATIQVEHDVLGGVVRGARPAAHQSPCDD